MKIFNVLPQSVFILLRYLRLPKISLILLLMWGFTSTVFADVYPFSCTYSRHQVVPPFEILISDEYDGGNGTIQGTYNDVTNVISYTINFFTQYATNGANFHAPAGFGSIGSVIIENTGFPIGVTSGTYPNSHVLTQEQETQLLAGLWYSNITTDEYPYGEIRAQIILGRPGESCDNNLQPLFSFCPTWPLVATTGQPFTLKLEGFDPNPGQTLGLEVVDLPFGPSNVTSLGNPFVREFTWTPVGNTDGHDLFGTGTFRLYDNCGGESFCKVKVEVNVVTPLICPDPVIVDQNTTIDFNTAVPTFTGDPDLQPYFTWDKSGPTPDTWKAIFNLGSKPLLVKKGSTITTSLIKGYAPGIIINSDCLKVEDSGHLVVNSHNKNAGDIILDIKKFIEIGGEIRNETKGPHGLPGAIKITSRADMTILNTGLVQILGVNGGNTISLLVCNDINTIMDNTPVATNNIIGRGISGPPLPFATANIIIDGLVKSYTQSYSGDQNSPNIKVVNLLPEGSISVRANSSEPLYDEVHLRGSKFDLWGGLLSWVDDNVIPGKIEVQAYGGIVVKGHGDDPTGHIRKSFGAIAAISTAKDAPGGIVDVRATGGISGFDRAFDVSGRNSLTTYQAQIRLWAGSILLENTSTNSSFNPVVDASSPVAGYRGGLNDLRACNSIFGITIQAGALVSAYVPPGAGSVQGINQFTSLNGIINLGTVIPAYITGTNCNTNLLYSNCTDVNQEFNIQSVSQVQEKSKLLQAYPNPFKQSTTISYELTTKAHVTLEIFNTHGKKVAVLANEQQAAGQHNIQWEANAQPGGVYFVNLKIRDKVEVGKLVLIK